MADQQKTLSISFRVGDGIIDHNNRKHVAPNVDPARIKDNIILVKEDIHDKYDEIFGAALDEYNAKQREKKRPDRQILDYYEKIRDSEKTRLFKEIVVQFGDKDSCGGGSENWVLCIEMLKQYAEEFQARNPNLIVFNCVTHCDEASPHLHINFIPVAHSKEKGLSLKNTMSGALREMGFTSSNKQQNEWVAWELSEQKAMEEILRRHGFSRDEKNIHRAYMEIDEFKKYADELRKLKKTVDETKPAADILAKQGEENYSVEDVALIKNENDLMKAEIAKRDELISALFKRKNAKLVKFEVYSDEKLLHIARELENMRIEFLEDSNALIVPDYAIPTCKEIAAKFKPTKSETLRDKLAFEIDTLIYSCDSLEHLWDKLREHGCEVKTDKKYISVKLPEAQRFIRLRTLGEDYLSSKLEERIANKDVFEKAIPKQMKESSPIEQTFYSAISETVISVRTLVYKPRKVRQKELYTFENDSVINNLSKQLTTMNEYDIRSRERLYQTADEIQQSIENCEKRVQELQNEYRSLQKGTSDNVEIRERLEILPDYIAKIQAEINEHKLKLSRVADVIQTYERIVEGNFIDNLIRANKAEQEEKNYRSEKSGLKKVMQSEYPLKTKQPTNANTMRFSEHIDTPKVRAQ